MTYWAKIAWIWVWCLLALSSVPSLADDNNAGGDLWADLGNSQMAAEKYSDAIYSYTAAIVKGNDTPEVFAKRGWAHYLLGNYKIGLEDLNKATAGGDARAGHFANRGLIHHALENYSAAIADFRQSLRLHPADAEVLTNRAKSYARKGDIRLARQDLDAAISRNSNNPNYAPAYVEKAWLWINEKRPEKAVLEINKLERVAPLGIWELEARATARLDLADWEGAVADADRALTLDQQYYWPYQIRTQARRRLGDYEGSLADADELLRRYPTNMWSMIERSMSLQRSGRTDTALAEMDRAIKENIDPPQAWLMRAVLNINAGRMKDALSDAQKSVALQPQSPVAVARLGWALLENGDPSAAEAECSKSLKMAEDASGYVCRTMARLVLKKLAAARKDVNRAHEMEKRSGDILYLLGRVELAQGKPVAALDKFDQAAKLSLYNQAGLFMYRGDAEKARGNIEEARKYYQTAKKFDTGRYTEALDQRLATLSAQ